MKRTLLLTMMLAAAVAFSGPAAAAPTADCGNTAKDPAGDNQNQTTGGETTPSLDLTEFFWRFTGGKVTANLRVAELTTAVQAPYTAHAYTIEFTVNKEPRLLTAVIDQAGQVGYQYGHPREIDSTDPAPSYEGDTTGTLHEGKDGVIEIEVPDAFKPVGATFGAATIEARQYAGRTAVGIPAPLIFVAPIADTMGGKSGFVGAPCAAPGTPTVTVPIATAAPLPAAAAPKLTVTAPKLVAKKVAKAKGFSVKLSTTAPLTAVTAQLKKGSKVVGKGSLKSLTGSGTLKVKVAKKLKKGTYTLAFTAAGGLKTAVAVKVK
jgi:methionine-rich copper-binding protein CopC